MQALTGIIRGGGGAEEGVEVGTTNTTMTKTTTRTEFTSEERSLTLAASARPWARQGRTDNDDCPTTRIRTSKKTRTTAPHPPLPSERA